MFAYGLGEHGRVVFLGDDPLAPLVLGEQGGREFVVTKTAAASPADCLGDAAGVCTVDDLAKTRNTMRVAVLAEFDADPAAAHFVSNGCRRAGAEERIKDEIAGVGGYMNNSMKKSLRLWSLEWLNIGH